MDAVGFYQWLHVFGGDIFEAKQVLPTLKDGDFDIIQVRLTADNLPLIGSIRQSIGEKSRTKLVVGLDYPVEYWKKKFPVMGKVKAAVQKADFVFATEFTICNALERLTGKPVYEIPHPADLQKISSYTVPAEKKEPILSVISKPGWTNYRRASGVAMYLQIRLRVIFFRDPPEETFIQKLRKNRIEVLICEDEAEFCRALAESKAVVAPCTYHDYGKEVIYAAALGSTLIGNSLLDASRRCYPIVHNTVNHLIAYLFSFQWITQNQGLQEFIRKNAWHKVQYYNWANLQNRFLRLLWRETQDERFEAYVNPLEMKGENAVFLRDIKYLDGKKTIHLQKNEVGVVCLVKNGMEYFPSFLNYYQTLGAKHFVFIDNGSTDGTMDFLKNRDNVTVYQTALSHKHYESEIRRAIIENLFQDSWVLCVDVDEFFDYPYSGKIALGQFLSYLNLHRYTTVISYMLDMFAKEADLPDEKCSDLLEHYRYYDITEIQKESYFNHNINFCNYNRLSDKTMPYYFGGIRRKYFGKETSKYMLIKHPLMFVDGKIEPVTDPHFCNKAYVADLNCLLKHYKFTHSFKDRLGRMVNDYAYFGKSEHEEYLKVLKEKNQFDFYSSSARELKDINELVESGFLKISRSFVKFVNSHMGRE